MLDSVSQMWTYNFVPQEPGHSWRPNPYIWHREYSLNVADLAIVEMFYVLRPGPLPGSNFHEFPTPINFRALQSTPR